MPFYQKPSFQIALLALILAGSYAYAFLTGGAWEDTLTGIAFDLLLLFLFSQLSLYFYSQFILPVRKPEDRSTIYRQLLLHLRGVHGPVIFIQDGRVLERRRRGARANPGILWVDSASAVVTRLDDGSRRALGPGIHFTASDEKLASAFSLHAQSLTIGPTPDDPVFEKLAEDASDTERRRYAEVQARSTAVAARTRDGNEVIPEINVVFKLDAMAAQSGGPGSRFGFSGDAVERAAHGEGVAQGPEADTRLHVAWNQLPGLLAVDLWREYLSKFTLDELFKPGFPAIPDLLQPETPVLANPSPGGHQGGSNAASRLLRSLNDSLERTLDQHGIREETTQENPLLQRPAAARTIGPENRTALQIIGQMMKERMTKAVVPILDDCGRLMKGHTSSEEFKRLKERGLAILDVRINGVRFDPAVEDQIVQHWNTGWLATARNDRRRVEQLELLASQSGKQRALLEHADALAEAIRTSGQLTVSSAVRSLLRSSQNEILTDERLRGRGGNELEALSQILRWVEASERD